MDNFSEILNNMTKPQVPELKHEEMLSRAILKAKEGSVVSWWWISIPVYLTGALLMKTLFMPDTTFLSNLKDMKSGNGFSSVLLFLVIPSAIILLNLVNMKKIHFLSGSPQLMTFFRLVWYNLLALLASASVIVIYLL